MKRLSAGDTTLKAGKSYLGSAELSTELVGNAQQTKSFNWGILETKGTYALSDPLRGPVPEGDNKAEGGGRKKKGAIK